MTRIKTLPRLYATEDVTTDNKVLQMKFMEINSGWEWYLTELDEKKKIAFGFVKGFEEEMGILQSSRDGGYTHDNKR